MNVLSGRRMSTYKLFYFDARGVAEVTRQLFMLAGQEFDDVRYNKEGWLQDKREMPFGQLPVLEVNGRRIPQSWAIARFVATQFGYAGKTDFEAALVDAFGDQLKDYMHENRPLHMVLIGSEQGDMMKLRKEIGGPARDKFFALVEKQLKENKSGFLVGDDVTWIDLAIAEHSDVLLGYMPDFLDGFPSVLTHRKKVQALPMLREWLKLRPEHATPCCVAGVCQCRPSDLEELTETMEQEEQLEAAIAREAAAASRRCFPRDIPMYAPGHEHVA